jgi:hypothetical protein
MALMSPADWRYAWKARRAGVPPGYASTIIAEARRTDHVTRSLALALVEQESGFRNVFGHDPTIFRGAGKVTKAAYLDYKRRRGPTGRGGMQGVGPTQLTWWEYQDAADREGGCWDPAVNIRVGLRVLDGNIARRGLRDGIAEYNGSGPAAQRYADEVLAKATRWHRILTS